MKRKKTETETQVTSTTCMYYIGYWRLETDSDPAVDDLFIHVLNKVSRPLDQKVLTQSRIRRWGDNLRLPCASAQGSPPIGGFWTGSHIPKLSR